jgi:5-methylcytosine-specific restriction endonuclease McrA
MVLKRKPWCSLCDRALAEIVDHIVPAWVVIAQAQASGRWPFDKWAGYYLLSNLQGLCRSCHGKKTDEDMRHVGPWPDAMEKDAAAPKKVWVF